MQRPQLLVPASWLQAVCMCTCTVFPCFPHWRMGTIVRVGREKFVGGVKLKETTVQLLLFADALMLVAEKGVERNLRMLEEELEKWQISWKKMKVLTDGLRRRWHQ